MAPRSKWLEELIVRLDELDEKSKGVSPEDLIQMDSDLPNVAPGETVVYQIDSDLQRIFVLAAQLHQEAVEAHIEAGSSSEESAQAVERARKNMESAELLPKVFWLLVTERLRDQIENHLGVRKGWKVVQFEGNCPECEHGTAILLIPCGHRGDASYPRTKCDD